MKTTEQFLDAVRAKHGLTSDYQLAKHLKIRPSRISNYRNGISLFDEETCLLIAADLELDPGYVFACIAAERANKPAVKAAWKHAAAVLYGLAAALALVAVLPFIHLPADPIQSAFDNSHYYANGLYIMRILAAYWWLAVPLVILAVRFIPKKARHDNAPVPGGSVR